MDPVVLPLGWVVSPADMPCAEQAVGVGKRRDPRQRFHS